MCPRERKRKWERVFFHIWGPLAGALESSSPVQAANRPAESFRRLLVGFDFQTVPDRCVGFGKPHEASLVTTAQQPVGMFLTMRGPFWTRELEYTNFPFVTNSRNVFFSSFVFVCVLFSSSFFLHVVFFPRFSFPFFCFF